jgi:hypothetical protein
MRVIMNKIRVLDLFYGIGVISRGLEATRGFETVAFLWKNFLIEHVKNLLY